MAVANDKTVVQAVVTSDLKKWLKRQAEAQGRSLSNYVNLVLEREQQDKQQQVKQTTK